MHQQVAPIEIYVKRAKQGKKQQQQQQKRKKLFAVNKQEVNRRSSEIQGTAFGKCLQAWPVYIQVQACGCSAE